MISYNTRNGSVNLSNEYFTELIGNAVSTCYGVAAMKPRGLKKYINKVIKQEETKHSVKVIGNMDHVKVEVHIAVVYGMNISAIAKSIVNKVKYVVFEATGIKVDKVTVKIDGIVQ